MRGAKGVASGCLAIGLCALPYLPGRAAGAQPASQAGPSSALQWSFDADSAGSLPDGAEVFDGAWAVRVEADAPSSPNAVCQTGTAEFPALALGDTNYGDLVMTAQVKPISGREDQAAGLIFRIQNRDNYYILRANALEDNVNFYKYAGGRRSLLTQSRAPVPSGQWQELRVEAASNSFRGFLNGQLVVEASDDDYAAGRVGLWTKSDSVTCFDDVDARSP